MGARAVPALAAADVGIAMGAAGSDVAQETADVTLMADDLDALPRAVKAVFVVLAPLGLTTLVLAVVADMGMSLLVTLNALRLLNSDA